MPLEDGGLPEQEAMAGLLGEEQWQDIGKFNK